MEALRLSAVQQAAMVFAIGFAIYAQHAVHQRPDDTTSWLILPIVAIVAAAVTRREPLPAAVGRPAAQPRAGALPRAALALLGVAAIAATTYLSATRRAPSLALLLWLAAPIVGALALRGVQVTPPRRAPQAWSRREVAGLAAIVVLAALLRTLWIASLPRAYFGDEPRVGMFLLNAYHAGAIPNFFSMGWNTWPVIGLSLQGLFAPLFGVHMWTLRLSSALMGTLGVLFTYLLARELYTARVACVAALLFALCRTAIDFSRVGIAHAQVLCLEPLALYLLWWALNRGGAVAYLWAGVASAWCLYTYNAGQLVPPLVFGWLLLGALVRPARLRTHWRGAALLAVGFALTIFPYLYFFTDAFSFGPNWDQWTIMARNRQTLGHVLDAWRAGGLAPAWAILSRQIWITWLGFGVLPGGTYILGYRRGGMLDDVSAALFVLGLGMAVRRRQAGDAFVLYWWLATVLAGGIATIDPPSFVRMVGLLPALAILAAVPIVWLTRSAAGAVARAIAAALAVALILAAGWENYHTYFVDYAATIADPVSELARYFETLPPDHRGALLGAEHFLQFQGELAVIEFRDRYRDVAEPSHYLPIHEQLTAPLALVLAPSQTTLSEYVRALYPDAPISNVTGPGGEPVLFRTLLVTPEAVRARTGLALAARRADGGTTDLGHFDPFDDGVALPADATQLSWSGSVYWPSDRRLAITVDAGQPTTVTVADAAPIVTDGHAPAIGTIELPRGWQPLRVDESLNRRGAADGAAQPRLMIALGPAAARSLNRWDVRPESAPQGLLATYTRQDGTLVHAVDPQLNAFAVEDRFPPESDLLVRMPFTAAWRGALRIDSSGAYEFEGLGSGPYTVRLDGAPLFTAAPSMPEQPALSRASRQLAEGLHPIEVDFDSTKSAHTTRRLFQLFWTPPGGVKELIPPTNFVH